MHHLELVRVILLTFVRLEDVNSDLEKINKIATALKVKIKAQDLKAKDPTNLLFAILSQWLPLASCVFRAIVEIIPNPAQAQKIRLPQILHPAEMSQADMSPSQVEEILLNGGLQESDPTVGFITKMFAVPTNELPQNQRRQLTAEEMRERGRQARLAATSQTNGTSEVDSAPLSNQEEEPKVITVASDGDSMIALTRLYSGRLKVGQTVYCVFPKYDSTRPPNDPVNRSHVCHSDSHSALSTCWPRAIGCTECFCGSSLWCRRIRRYRHAIWYTLLSGCFGSGSITG